MIFGVKMFKALIIMYFYFKSDEEIQKILEDEVKKLSETNLAPYKAPTVVVLHRNELPKTSTRKVKRKDLKEWYESL